jgi:voltage-gated potassium channel
MFKLIPSFKYLKELYYALGIILGIIVMGVIGFMIIEEYNFVEALYMTVITVSTVGFKEVRELSDLGRYFTTFLILFSFGTFAYTVSTLSKYIFTGTIQQYFKKYKMDSSIKRMSGHIVLCGAGRNGMESLQNLKNHGKEVVVIDQKKEAINALLDHGVPYIEGDATEEETLRMAGIEEASALISSLPKDTDNVFVVLTARELNSDIRIVSRCSSDSSESKLKIAGANVIIMPDKVGGARMAGFVINHNLNRFLDSISLREGNKVYLAEFNSNELPERLRNKNVSELVAHLETKCRVIGIMPPSFEYVVNPDDDFKVSEDSQIFFFGKTMEIEKLKNKLKSLN